MYLMIQNTGIAPIQSFTVLGLSTARGKDDKIGQFGSGSKHSINLLLRNNITPIIFLGDKELQFFCKDEKMGDKPYKQVYYKFDGKEYPTGFALEFGELDWNNTNMALRELISNAIDSVGYENIVLDLVEEPTAYSDSTTIYVPLNDSIKEYYTKISEYFLHFKGLNNQIVLTKPELNHIKIYRKGVFVLSLEKNSMFDYNFDSETKIDESRNMSEYTVLADAAKTLGKDKELLTKFIKHLVESEEKIWETNFNYYQITSKAIYEVWKDLYGDALVANCETIAGLVRKNGYKVIIVKQGYDILSGAITTAISKLGHASQKGWIVNNPSLDMIRTYNKVWTTLQNMGFTMNKIKPKLKAFTEPIIEGEQTLGFYEPVEQVVYISNEYESVYSVHLEELAHYITGANDGDRAFQTFAFDVAARLAFSKG